MFSARRKNVIYYMVFVCNWVINADSNTLEITGLENNYTNSSKPSFNDKPKCGVLFGWFA